jgi:threonine dehydrogenase-like Zn-dependent dehydrogenase
VVTPHQRPAKTSAHTHQQRRWRRTPGLGDNTAADVLELTGGVGADVSIEAVGYPGPC